MHASTKQPSRAEQRANKALVWVVFVGAIVSAFATLAMATVAIVRQLTTGEYDVSLNAETPAPASFGSATINEGTLSAAQLTVSDLTPGASALLIGGQVAFLLTALSIAVAVAVLCWGNLKGKPFTRGASRSFALLGAALLIGSLLSQALTGFGGWLVAEQLNGVGESNQYWPLSLNISALPIVAGFVVMVIALSFEVGERMQRDTDGLV
ncbi:hypothetical protein [Lysinibacter cavernae]|uniref:DUF2975 domain-containing protein n=1 Tax=Lysinibacter cavernae TaxID=1640652 RepID=A0A7X5TUD0_9MICO|nr:hypothetical protein [Lysinibacter cavernae]NIH54263.1 hypothetical protein [Lysinibacter cavernae]